MKELKKSFEELGTTLLVNILFGFSLGVLCAVFHFWILFWINFVVVCFQYRRVKSFQKAWSHYKIYKGVVLLTTEEHIKEYKEGLKN